MSNYKRQLTDMAWDLIEIDEKLRGIPPSMDWESDAFLDAIEHIGEARRLVSDIASSYHDYADDDGE